MNDIYQNKKALINTVISGNDTVLDVGFWGQGVSVRDDNWVHNILKVRAKDVYGLDLSFDDSMFPNKDHYIKASAENFKIDKKFDVIFAGDLIEHLSNPGFFLDCAKAHLNEGGRLIMTTPNAFNLFNITEKLSKGEPTVNYDHTCYFNRKTLGQLLGKNGWSVDKVSYIYSLGLKHKESFKKKVLNGLYKFLSLFTDAYIETLVITAVPKK
jgi:2-polyprenyl-3-methyl-5-hydroxy-6-metoxy-1,4-benzoquinol methylase